MNLEMKKECPKCRHTFPMDFTICPNCGKKYRKLRC